MFARQDQRHLASNCTQEQIKEVLTEEEAEVLNLKNWKHSGAIGRNREWMINSAEKGYFCLVTHLAQWYIQAGVCSK